MISRLTCAVILGFGLCCPVSAFEDDFERADGPLDGDGWTAIGGDWTIVGGAARNGASATEEDLFIGSPPTVFPTSDFVMEVDVDWCADPDSFCTSDGAGQPGRHGGISFCFQGAANRYAGSGYTLWWIDRGEDRGWNVYRSDDGTVVDVSGDHPVDSSVQPPAAVRLEVTGPTITVFSDDEMVLSFDDDTYRGGSFGLSTWSNQTAQYDNVRLEFGSTVEDDFERADGPLDGSGWTAIGGEWVIAGGAARNGAAAAEEDLFFGSPPNQFAPGDFTMEVDVDWCVDADNFCTPDGAGAPGRHAGVSFCFQQPANRFAGSGYTLWWIDRGEDRGWNVYRSDAGTIVDVSGDNPVDSSVQPPGRVRLEVTGPTINVLSDDEMVLSFDDDTYRGGYFGLSTWSNQTVQYDNFVLQTSSAPPAVVPCFNVERSGLAVSLDAGCSNCQVGTCESFLWDLGDGRTATGATVEHSYTAAGDYTITLAVRDDQGNEASTEQTVSVAPASRALSFADDFERADGMLDRDGWTAIGGEWTIVGGTARSGASAAEEDLFIGSPSTPFAAGDFVMEVDLDWCADPENFCTPDGAGQPGRHAGISFCFQEPANRFTGSGYTLWWIDRGADRGWNVYRSDAGTVVDVSGDNPVDSSVQPPASVRLEVTGPTITVFSDDEMVLSFDDDTYRGGHFGLSTWVNQTVTYDNVRVEVIPTASDDFQRADGRLDGDGWTAIGGEWTLVGGTARNGASGAEEDLFYGSPPTGFAEGDFTMAVDLDWCADAENFCTPDGAGQPGRHGGISFCFQEPANRFAGSGYTLWWIDRGADRGWNVYRSDAGAIVDVSGDHPVDATVEPPGRVRLEVIGRSINVFSDDELALTFDDDTYRGGYFGLSTWANQTVTYDNFILQSSGGAVAPAVPQIQGDCNQDGVVNVTDVNCIVRLLFTGFDLLDPSVPALPCATPDGDLAILDLSQNEAIDVADFVVLADFLFSGGAAPPGVAVCGPIDETLGCPANPGCE